MYQKLNPFGAISIGSVEINTSLLMMMNGQYLGSPGLHPWQSFASFLTSLAFEDLCPLLCRKNITQNPQPCESHEVMKLKLVMKKGNDEFYLSNLLPLDLDPHFETRIALCSDLDCKAFQVTPFAGLSAQKRVILASFRCKYIFNLLASRDKHLLLLSRQRKSKLTTSTKPVSSFTVLDL